MWRVLEQINKQPKTARGKESVHLLERSEKQLGNTSGIRFLCNIIDSYAK